MKENIKKLSVLVGVPVITLIFMVVMASAGPAIPHGIKGEYAGSGPSTCVTAPKGFKCDDSGCKLYDVNDNVSTGTSFVDVVYTFNKDGTGSADGHAHLLTLAPLPGDGSVGSVVDFTYKFTYTVTAEGLITMTVGPDHFRLAGGAVCFDIIPKDGIISGDGKTITISCGVPLPLTFMNCSDKTPPPLPTQQNLCVTTYVLTK
jgi:hypothetical protein